MTGNWNGFRGRAKRIDDIDLPKLGAQIGVGEDELHAFIDVETQGSGFDGRGRPRILFERHKFYQYVPANKRKEAVDAGLASRRAGGYGRESDQYPKLMRAMKIDATAALMSCSYGLGQVMGFNHKVAGYDSVQDMVRAFMDDEENHLQASVNFIKANGLDEDLRNHNWAGFARGYNGPGYKRNRYDEKLADAFEKWARIKNTPWPQEPSGDTAEKRERVPPSNVQVIIGTLSAVILAGLAAWWDSVVNWFERIFT